MGFFNKPNVGTENSGGGANGKDGKSAYEIAVQYGFNGSEQEWLVSLQGKDGQAGKDGKEGKPGVDGREIELVNNGTSISWRYKAKGRIDAWYDLITVQEITGSDGKDGESAYEAWISLGNRGSKQDFIDSLKGKNGQNGKDGADGSDGREVELMLHTDNCIYWRYKGQAQGIGWTKLVDMSTLVVNGQDGKSAYTLWIEEGNTGSIAEFLISLKGQDGNDGVNGKSAYELAVINGFMGTESEWLESLKGKDAANVDVSILATKDELKQAIDNIKIPEINNIDAAKIVETDDKQFVSKSERDKWNSVTNGADGKSAYEIWLELGNVGSEQDFIDSLVGQNGSDGIDGKSAYRIAVDNGYNGSESEWLQSLVGREGQAGLNGIDGSNGESAYEIWIKLGNSGTEQDFINSLIGRDGKDGTDGSNGRDGQDGQNGQDGRDGRDGVDGQNGKSAYEIWLELGNVGSEQDFIDSLKGADGVGGGSGSGDAIDIAFDNSNCNMAATNVQDALTEVFQYASNGKALVSEAVAGKGFTADANMTFKELADRVSAIPTAPATFNGSTEIEATLGEDNLKAGDIVKLINNNTLITKINNESNPNIAPEGYTNHSCFSEDGTLFAAPSTGGKNIRIYEVDESGMFKQLCVITPSVTTVNSYVSFSSDNKYLLATLTSNIVLFKRVGDTFEEVFKLTGSSNYTYVEAQFMYDNYFVYSYRGDTSIYKIDSSNDSVALVHKLDDTTAFIKLRYNKNLNIIYGYTSNNVRAIQLTKSGDDFTSEQIFLASHSNVKNIDVSPSGEYIVIASTTGTLIYKYTGTSYLRVEAALVSVTLPSYAVGVSWINNNTFIVAGTGFILGVNRNGDQFSADLQAADETFVGYGLSTSALINKFLVVNTRTGVEIYKVNINKGVAAYKVTDTSYFKNCEGLGMLTVDGDAGDVRIINKFLERNSELLYTKDEVDAIIYKEIKTALEILGIDDNDLLSTVPLTF